MFHHHKRLTETDRLKNLQQLESDSVSRLYNLYVSILEKVEDYNIHDDLLSLFRQNTIVSLRYISRLDMSSRDKAKYFLKTLPSNLRRVLYSFYKEENDNTYSLDDLEYQSMKYIPDMELSVFFETMCSIVKSMKPTGENQAFLYYYENGIDVQQIAGIMGKNPETIRKGIKRVEEKLRKTISEEIERLQV